MSREIAGSVAPELVHHMLTQMIEHQRCSQANYRAEKFLFPCYERLNIGPGDF